LPLHIFFFYQQRSIYLKLNIHCSFNVSEHTTLNIQPNFKDDEYTARIAHSEKEAHQLKESDFKFIYAFNDNKL